MTSTVGLRDEALARSLERTLGSAHVTEWPRVEIDGLRPRVLARPGSSEEVAACLAIASEMHAAVTPAGNMTWLDAGNPLARVDLVLSLERLNRVLDYSAPDLTATLQAGASILEFNKLAGAENQWLPLDAPGVESASIGGMVACGSSGPLRFGFGTPRDYVIGLKLAHADGKQSKCGGKVVKNVAGYDLNKLYIGSFGTLAVITEATVKLRPAPERMATVALRADDDRVLFELTSRVLKSRLRPVSLTILNSVMAEAIEFGEGSSVCLVRFAGSPQEVAHQISALAELRVSASAVPVADVESNRIWRSIADLDRLQPFAMKLSVLSSQVEKAYASCVAQGEILVAADPGAGIVRAAFDGDGTECISKLKALRTIVERLGGTAFVERAPLAVRREVNAWSDPGATANLMRTIKRQFDPESILNPGKFVAGI